MDLDHVLDDIENDRSSGSLVQFSDYLTENKIILPESSFKDMMQRIQETDGREEKTAVAQQLVKKAPPVRILKKTIDPIASSLKKARLDKHGGQDLSYGAVKRMHHNLNEMVKILQRWPEPLYTILIKV